MYSDAWLIVSPSCFERIYRNYYKGYLVIGNLILYYKWSALYTKLRLGHLSRKGLDIRERDGRRILNIHRAEHAGLRQD